MSEGGFFWFDPFGQAPADAEVSGRAGGLITWGGVPGWPFERERSDFPSIRSLLRKQPRYEPHIQFRTAVDPDAPPSPEQSTTIKYARRLLPVRLTLAD